MKKTKQFASNTNGSALIMTIVLTVMLAAVAVMFLAMARMDKASTTNIAENKMLDLAAGSIVEIINKHLVYDVPGVAKKADMNEADFPQYFEYRDYPDACDPWLASFEPYLFHKEPNLIACTYKWRQISDITGYLSGHGFEVQDVNVKPVGISDRYVVKDYPIFDMNEGGDFNDVFRNKKAIHGISADADGDGIADSKWFELSDMRTPTGRVFAAVRIIDNGAMANVNTAYKFDPEDSDANNLTGVSQTTIDLQNLLKTGDSIDDDIHNVRNNHQTWPDFLQGIVWDFNSFPENGCLPFDIADELELRYRFCINGINASRFENSLLSTIAPDSNAGNLYDSQSSWSLDDWLNRTTEPNVPLRRHLLTTYNCDRIIDPNGNKMTNINDANLPQLYSLFKKARYSDDTAAQIAVNIHDYRDADSDVNCYTVNGKNYYGFEAPCVYISEIAYKHWKIDLPFEEHKSYAIELYKPYTEDENADLTNWVIYVGMTPIPLNNWTSGQYYVIRWKEDPTQDSKPIEVETTSSVQLLDKTISPGDIPFQNGTMIRLIRWLPSISPIPLVIDENSVPIGMTSQLGTRSNQRDIRKHQCIRRMWSGLIEGEGNVTLGTANTGFDDENTDANTIPAYPANVPFTNVGQLGSVFKKSAFYSAVGKDDTIGYTPELKLEENVRVNLLDANLYPVFNYITALKTSYPHESGETRVKGRININTAPARVIAQLPWVSERSSGAPDLALAKAIVAYRDKWKEVLLGAADPNYNYDGRPGNPGFESTARLMKVRNLHPMRNNYSIDLYARDGSDLADFPDLSHGTTGDEAIDDMEERDVIFARISDLVTVRSDVFTAYILVRVGTDGPQKRYIAVLDRSQVKSPGDKVIIRAFQHVPDNR